MATSLNEKKIREGLQLSKDAEKCLQTNWLKWKPDYDNAADKFTKAGTAFKVGKSYNQAKDAFLKAADAYCKNHSLYHSGKALEQAGTMLKEMKKFDEAAELMQKAGSLFQENGTPDTAAMVLIKAAKICERTNLNKAVELYQAAGELREMDDKLREAAEPYNKATQLLIKQKKFEEAVKSMTKNLDLYGRVGNSAVQCKIILELVVTHLHESDYVAADKCFKDGFEVSGFGISDESEAIEQLLDAYDRSDAELIKTIVAKPLFRHLDNELSKLARDLKPSEEFNIGQQTTELRLVSSDIAKLRIDKTKPAASPPPTLHGTTSSPYDFSSPYDQNLELEDDENEENPPGISDSPSSGERTDKIEATSGVGEGGEGGTTNDERSAGEGELNNTASADTPPAGDGEESTTKDVEEEEDEFEGGIC